MQSVRPRTNVLLPPAVCHEYTLLDVVNLLKKQNKTVNSFDYTYLGTELVALTAPELVCAHILILSEVVD